MSEREHVIQRVRAWLKAAGAAAGLTDAQVVVDHDDGGPRPSAAHLAVRVLSIVDVGEPEIVNADDGAGGINRYAIATKEATITISAYGDAAAAWLERAHRRRTDPAVLASVLVDTVTGDGISLEPASGAVEVPVVVADGWERRVSRDYLARYVANDSDDVEAADAVDVVTLDLDLEDRTPDPDPLTVSITVSTA